MPIWNDLVNVSGFVFEPHVLLVVLAVGYNQACAAIGFVNLVVLVWAADDSG